MLQADRDFLGTLALVVLGPMCCLGIPLLLAAGAGVSLSIVGVAIPVALLAAIGAFLVGRWWRARS